MTPLEFEARTGLSGYKSAQLLRVSKSKWYEWRKEDRPVPAYIQASMEAHCRLIEIGELTVPD